MQALSTYERPLFGRVKELVVNPFELGDTAQMIAVDDPAVAIDAQLVTGGYPRLCAEWRGAGTRRLSSHSAMRPAILVTCGFATPAACTRTALSVRCWPGRSGAHASCSTTRSPRGRRLTRGRAYITDTDLSKRLTAAKDAPERAWPGGVSSVVLQQAVRFTANARFRVLDNRRLRLPKVGDVEVRWSRNLPSVPSSVTVIRDAAGRYFASFAVERSCTGARSRGSAAGSRSRWSAARAASGTAPSRSASANGNARGAARSTTGTSTQRGTSSP